MKIISFLRKESSVYDVSKKLEEDGIETLVEDDVVYFKLPNISQFTTFGLNTRTPRLGYSNTPSDSELEATSLLYFHDVETTYRGEMHYLIYSKDAVFIGYYQRSEYRGIGSALAGAFKNPEGPGFFRVEYGIAQLTEKDSNQLFIDVKKEDNLIREQYDIKQEIVTGAEDLEWGNQCIIGHIFLQNPLTNNFIPVPGINLASVDNNTSAWKQYGNILFTDFGLKTSFSNRLVGRGMVIVGLDKEDMNDL